MRGQIYAESEAITRYSAFNSQINFHNAQGPPKKHGAFLATESTIRVLWSSAGGRQESLTQYAAQCLIVFNSMEEHKHLTTFHSDKKSGGGAPRSFPPPLESIARLTAATSPAPHPPSPFAPPRRSGTSS